MLFTATLIRKIGGIVKIAAIGFALGMFTCWAASCSPQQDSLIEQAQPKRPNSRMMVKVENSSFQDARIYIVYEGHTPVRIGRVTAASDDTIERVLVHTASAFFLIKLDDGTLHVVGPLLIQPGMDVRLVLRNSMIQSIALPLWRS